MRPLKRRPLKLTKKPFKLKYQAYLLGHVRPGEEARDFPSLERAIEWCLIHARENACSAQIVFGAHDSGKVVWRLNAREARKRPPRRTTRAPRESVE
jgi:hypothetical protein